MILLLLLGMGAVVGVTVLAARWQDEAYREGLGQALRGALAMHEDVLGRVVRDYAFWDETVRNAAEPDPAWSDQNIGPYVHRSFELSLSLLLDPSDVPIYAAANEMRAAPDAFAGLTAELAPLLAKARSNPMDSAQAHVAYLRIGNVVHLVAAAPVTTESATPESLLRRSRPILVFARAFDPDRLDRLATLLPMSTVGIADAAEGPLTVPLPDPSGVPAAWLTATTTPPVGAAIEELSIILGILFATMAALGALILVQEHRAQRQYERHLIALVREAEQANKAKSVFLAQMSHELRTPLNAIIGFTEVLKRQLAGDSRHVESLDHILSGGHHLLALINEVLDLARIESGGYRLEEGEVGLAELLRESIALSRPDAGAAQVRLSPIPPAAADIVLWVDDRAMRQMLLNLLSNAIRYSHRGGTVAVRVAREPDGGLRIAVEDQGIGIASAELGSVRQPFERSSLARQHSVGGMGLGLSIVSSLIALHGGRLELSSEPGAGTTAALVLPADRVRVSAQAPAA